LIGSTLFAAARDLAGFAFFSCHDHDAPLICKRLHFHMQIAELVVAQFRARRHHRRRVHLLDDRGPADARIDGQLVAVVHGCRDKARLGKPHFARFEHRLLGSRAGRVVLFMRGRTPLDRYHQPQVDHLDGLCRHVIAVNRMVPPVIFGDQARERFDVELAILHGQRELVVLAEVTHVHQKQIIGRALFCPPRRRAIRCRACAARRTRR
jgi:hypothetical protein